MFVRTTFRLALGLALVALGTADLSAQVSINRAFCSGSPCPKPLVLVPGIATRVNLRGQRLGQLTVGVVIDGGGFPTRGVTVELGPRTGRRGTRRNVMLTSTGGPRAILGLQLQFRTKDGGNVKAPLQLSVAAAQTVTTGVVVAAPLSPTVTNEPLATPLMASVSSVSPSSVNLAPGSSATVVLQGANLSLLQGAQIVRNGSAVTNVTAALQPSSDPARREVRLTAPKSASLPWNLPLELVVTARFQSGGTLTAPVRVQVKLPTARLHEDDYLGEAIDGALVGANTVFSSCGASAQGRQFTVNLPQASYTGTGTVPRLEYQATSNERLYFLVKHSLDPTDIFTPDELLNLFKSAHPSPIPHSVSKVRMCLVPMRAMNNWKFTGTEQRGGNYHAIVTVQFSGTRLRARGMPADPAGLFDALTVGIKWGSDITDNELPDYLYSSPEVKVLLPLEVADGRIGYGSILVEWRAPRGRWSSQLLGPGSVETQLRAYARERMDQIAAEIKVAFEASATRNAISSAIMSRLQTVHDIGYVVSLKPFSGEMWEVGHL